MATNFSYVFDASSTEIVYDKRSRENSIEESPKKLPVTSSEATAPLVPITIMGRAEFRLPHDDEIVLYFYPHSFYSQVVLLAMYQRQISFTAFVLDIHGGDQFREEYLRMNPRGEVPVLNDGTAEKVFTDAAQILRHIESPFVEAHGPSLLPLEPSQRRRAEELAGKLHRLKVEALSFGSVIFRDLILEPQGVFAEEVHREGIREYLRKRRAIYRTEALNFPEFADALNKKLIDIQKDWHFLERREDFEEIIRSFERVLDECEDEIASHLHHRGFVASKKRNSGGDSSGYRSQRNSKEISSEFGNMLPSPNTQNSNEHPHDWWLCAPTITIADIFLGVILWRIHEIGFTKRLLGSRTNLVNYFERIRELESFQRATTPNFLEVKGTAVLAEPKVEPPKLLTPVVPRPRSTERDFPWWIIALPLGTIIVYGIWGWIEGPPRPTIPQAVAQTIKNPSIWSRKS